MANSGNDFEKRQKVLGYPIDVVDSSLALSMIEKSWQTSSTMHVVTLNAEMVIQAQADNRLDRIIRHAHLIVPDGAGAVLALKLDGHSSTRVPGVELADSALLKASLTGQPVALIGSRKEVIEKLVLELPKKYPGLNICHAVDGYFSKEDEESVVKEVASKEPKLVLVAMGVPRQEYFIDKWMSLFPGACLMGVGGSLDVFAGTVKRAPVIYQRLNLEWFYRLLKEPWRFTRMAQTLPNFAIQVLIRRFFNQPKVPLVRQIPEAPRNVENSPRHVKTARHSSNYKKRSSDS